MSILHLPPNQFQAPIEEWFASSANDTAKHCTVNSVAGSGKTTQLRRCARLLPQGTHAQYLAFNKAIAEETNQLFTSDGVGVRASTLHSAGMKLLRDTVEPNLDVKADKYRKLVYEYLDDHAGLASCFRSRREAVSCLLDLLDLSRLTLTSPDNPETFREAGARWGCECPDGYALATAKILKAGARMAEKTGIIDFTDMLTLNHRWDLKPSEPFEWVLCDEVQDFSAAQLDLILRHCDEDTRGLFVGDPKQSIMGFAFAAFDSYAQVQQRLQSIEYPLSICWRCPPNHLELARELVPQIQAAPGRVNGLLETVNADTLHERAERGDLIICRRTAPLIKLAAGLIRQGKPAKIKGRDFAGSIIAHLREITYGHNASRLELTRQLGAWYAKEVRALEARSALPSILNRLDAKVEMTLACIEAAPDPGDLRAVEVWVTALFADAGGANPPIQLSTIHRAKGLEADTVWILDSDTLGEPFPRQTQEEAQQELNLRYVALTRSRNALYLVQSEGK